MNCTFTRWNFTWPCELCHINMKALPTECMMSPQKNKTHLSHLSLEYCSSQANITLWLRCTTYFVGINHKLDFCPKILVLGKLQKKSWNWICLFLFYPNILSLSSCCPSSSRSLISSIHVSQFLHLFLMLFNPLYPHFRLQLSNTHIFPLLLFSTRRKLQTTVK